MENSGVVKELDGTDVIIEVAPVSAGCGRCHEEGGCGSNLLNQSLRSKKASLYRLPNQIAAKVGDRVVLSVPEGAVLRASLWAYLIPAILLILGAALGTALFAHDAMALLGGGFGLMLGLLVLRYVQKRYLSLGVERVGFHLRFADDATSVVSCKLQGR